MNIEPIMEKICDLCHWPYVEPNEDSLKDVCDHCETCTIEAEIRAVVETENAQLRAENERIRQHSVSHEVYRQVCAERDAAVADISKEAYHERKMPCFVCKYKDAFGDELRKHCQNCNQFNSHFEWRGPSPQDAKGEYP